MKKVAVVVCLLLTCLGFARPAQAQSCGAAKVFQTPVLSASGCATTLIYLQNDARASTTTLAAADFNGDGKLDLVATQSGSIDAELAILLGNGDGTFQGPSYILPNGDNSLRGGRWAVTGDFNGDGKPDIVAGTDEGFVTVLLNNGDGTFTMSSEISPPGTPGGNTIAGAVGDFNGDGKLDFVIVDNSTTPGTAIIYFGNGDGTFGATPLSITVGNSPRSIGVGDFNRDGKPDIAVANNDNTFSILINNGGGTFKTPVSYPTGSNPVSTVVADFNGDGLLDLATLNNAGDVTVLLGNGDGTFQSAVHSGVGIVASDAFPAGFAAGDFNHDGKTDLIVAVGNQSAVAVLFGNGDGTFKIPLYYAADTVPETVVVGDFNGDGNLDWIAGTSGNNTLQVELGKGDGTFSDSRTYLPFLFNAFGRLPQTPAPASVAFGDFNRDGKQDMAIVDAANSNVTVLLGNGDGTFTETTNYELEVPGTTVAVGDVNGDGIPDLVVGLAEAFFGHSFEVLIGNGDGTFQSAYPVVGGGGAATFLALADVNRDGKLDVILNSNSSTSAWVVLGNGDGTFQSGMATPAAGSGNSNNFALADMNGDGKLDLVVAASADNNVNILLGNGDGTFNAPSSFPTGKNPGMVAVADFNGDGKLDVASSDFSDGTVGVLLGNGDGTLQAYTPYSVFSSQFWTNWINTFGQPQPPPRPTFVVAGDFNRDGHVDLLVGDLTPATEGGDINFSFFQYNNGVQLFLGNGDGTFQAEQSYLAGTSVQFMAVGDADGNGSPDVAVVNQGDVMVSMLLNQTPQVSTTTTTLASSANPSIYGQPVTFTASVAASSGTPTGTVTFKDGATTLGSAAVVSGSAALTTSALAVGTHSITASYGGDATHSGSASTALQQVVNQATTTTTLASSANPSFVGQTVTYTATVTSQDGGAVSGNVTFKDGATTLGTVALANGQASISETYNATGTHNITASYSGDSNDAASTSAALRQTVASLPAATTTKVTTSGSPSNVGQAVTFTATVTSTFGPIPNGENVTFSDGNTTLGTVPLSGGSAALTTSSLKAGNHTIKASYGGDATFKPSSGTVKQTVSLYSTTTTLTSSLNPSTFGQTVTLTATIVTGAPGGATGTVTFKNGSSTLGNETVNAGKATITLTTKLPAGVLSLTATYNGDSQSGKSTGSLTQTVNQATSSTTLSSSPNPSTQGQAVKFTATVTSPTTTPTGSVTFKDGATTLGSANLAGGKATFSTSALATGTHNITAVYAGTANIGGSTSPVLVQTVN